MDQLSFQGWGAFRDQCDGCLVSTTLPKTKIAQKGPENGWLEDDPFLLGWRNLASANC